MSPLIQAVRGVFTSCTGRITSGVPALLAAIVLTLGALPATAQTPPVIDGNGTDLLDFIAAIGDNGCGIDRSDPRDDIAIADPKIDPCAPLEDTDANGVPDYYVNGKDLRRFGFAYDRTTDTVYLLWRMEGIVGDVDGNGNPDNNLCEPPANFVDQIGIGSEDTYEARIDVNCDGEADITFRIQGETLTVTGTSSGATSFAYRAGPGDGRDLEARITGVELPEVFQVFAFSGAIRDGLGEDVTPEIQCGEPKPAIDLVKSVLPAVICPGGTADFTVTVTNTGNVGLTNVTVVDNLPAGLSYVSTVSNTCGGAVNPAGNQITYGPFSLAADASCTIVIRAGRSAECTGEQVNNATVEGQFQSACINNGEAILVTDTASATVLCGNVTCSITAPDTNVCPGETVEICGPEGNYTYAWSNGATTRCITVGAGTYSLVVTDITSGCASTNNCSVTITESPRPTCSISAPDTNVCPGETVEICGPEGNYTYAWSNGAVTRCITVGAGTYSLVITDLATGCVSNNSCTVTITENPRPNCSISAPQTSVCPGGTVQICGPEGNYSYAWSNGATTRCITVGPGTYSLVITDLGTGCVSNNPCSVTITESSLPNCTISAPDTNVCPGETVQICGPEGNYSYAWSNGATTRCITVGAGTYSLVITDLAGGCVSTNPCSVTIVENPRPNCSISAPDTEVCGTETVQICGPEGNYSYAWSNGATTRCITVGQGTYSLVITDLATGCVSNNPCSVTITQGQLPNCTISAPDTQVCPGETVQICGPEGNWSYAWSNGATTRCITVGAGTYSLTITDLATGCASTNPCSVTIVENPRPTCSISAPDTNVCPGETVQICGPEGPYSYAWSNGAVTRCITVGAGTYSLVITNTETGCVSNNSCSVTIVENPRPTCSIQAPDTTVCGDETVQICGPEGAYTYAWSNGATTRCINVGVGTYSLIITNTETGCVSDNSCSVTITSETPPTVNVTVNDQGPLCVGATFDLCGTVQNTGDRTADLEVRYTGRPPVVFEDVPAGQSRNYCFEDVVMPACTGDGVVFTVRAVATNNCGTSQEDTATETVPCSTPQIDVEKVAQESQVNNGATIHYTITVRNTSTSVALENVRVVDDLCAYAVWTGVSNPAPYAAPTVGTAGGNVEWRFASLAPGAEQVITFEVRADVAAGGGVCPTTVQCDNDVVATGDCVGSGGQGTVRDEDSTVTPIVCVAENCPRTVGFWSQQCAQRSGGSTKFNRQQMDQITACVDDASSFFSWSDDFGSFCSVINPSKMDQRKQAKRQFAALLANFCTGDLELVTNNGAEIKLDLDTPISCSGLEADTIGELIDEVDDLLAELEGQNLSNGDVKAKYAAIISCTDAINNASNIPTTSECEHQGTTSGSSSGTGTGGSDTSADQPEVDMGMVQLYRAFPNPFATTTQFAYEVEAEAGAQVDITVYNVAGREVRKLVSGFQSSGRQFTAWDGRDDAGVLVTRGVYFVRTVIAGQKAPVQRLLFVR